MTATAIAAAGTIATATPAAACVTNVALAPAHALTDGATVLADNKDGTGHIGRDFVRLVGTIAQAGGTMVVSLIDHGTGRQISGGQCGGWPGANRN